MRLEQIIESLQTLDEVRMGVGDLEKFASSPAAAGIRAGFEAELCFARLGGSEEDPDSEPEQDLEQDIKVSDIQSILDFYHDGEYNGRSAISRAEESMRIEYNEWRDLQMVNRWFQLAPELVRAAIEPSDDEFQVSVENYLRDELGLSEQQIKTALNAGKAADEITSSKQLRLFSDDNEAYAHYAEARDHVNELIDEQVREELENEGDVYTDAKETWESDSYDDDDWDENTWLNNEGIYYMSDYQGDGNLTWPFWNYSSNESGNDFNEASANKLKLGLENTLGVSVKVSSGYHTAARLPGLWIIESDSSLEANPGDMPAEIISPPLPLAECIEKMRAFFSWAADSDAYTNSTTGFHVGISLPGQTEGDIDYLKLALFLGDQYILQQFGRSANTYCASAMKKISSDIKTSRDSTDITNTLDKMRHGLIELASSSIRQTLGHGKYTSINLKGDYVEFRSMGGEVYLEQIDFIINTVQRFALAMSIAGDRNAEREEYAKKLYKLLSPIGADPIIGIFAEYSSGKIPKAALKGFIKQAQLQRNINRRAANQIAGEKYWFSVSRDQTSIEVVATSSSEALDKARKEWDLADPMSKSRYPDSSFQVQALRRYDQNA